MATKFYEVTCTTSNGIVLQDRAGNTETIRGTKLVPAEFWERWEAEHADFPMFRDGSLMAVAVVEDVPVEEPSPAPAPASDTTPAAEGGTP